MRVNRAGPCCSAQRRGSERRRSSCQATGVMFACSASLKSSCTAGKIAIINLYQFNAIFVKESQSDLKRIDKIMNASQSNGRLVISAEHQCDLLHCSELKESLQSIIWNIHNVLRYKKKKKNWCLRDKMSINIFYSCPLAGCSAPSLILLMWLNYH